MADPTKYKSRAQSLWTLGFYAVLLLGLWELTRRLESKSMP